MIQVRKMQFPKVLGAALIGFVMMAATLAAPFATAASADPIAARIDAAFSVAVAAKGDLPDAIRCVDQTWPAINSSCLVTSDGEMVRRARYVTVGYQSGESTTVLVRTPVPQMAAR